MSTPPRDLEELRARADAIAGRALDELSATYAIAFEGREGPKTKGKTGELLERILGASGGSQAVHDFPALGIELKTIPVNSAMRPRESTYVCTLQLAEADRAEWASSWARAKLSHVLWMPIVLGDGPARVGVARFWRPTSEQESVLASDFEDALGAVALGGVEALTARTGRWLHVRPKAASSRDRTWSIGRDDGDWIATVPRGFYLRTRFTAALLHDLAATPE